MKQVIGIISYLPSNSSRESRKERLLRLLKQLEMYWPELPIIIVAQNWGNDNFLPKEYIDRITVYNYNEPLGILKARQTLREKFLSTDYEQIIMFDDDAIIKAYADQAREFLEKCKANPKGFMFLKGHRKDPLGIYDPAQLNGCCISRWLIEAEPLRDEWDPQKNGIFEDVVYAHLFHWKYPEYEFEVSGFACIQWSNPKYPLKSTWTITDHKCLEKTKALLEKIKQECFDWREKNNCLTNNN